MGLAPEADLPKTLADLNARLGLPAGLSALGVQRSQFESLADAALADNAHKTNPRPLTRADYLVLLEAAF
jgi:4-hydroxybutyrate dehydrogenase